VTGSGATSTKGITGQGRFRKVTGDDAGLYKVADLDLGKYEYKYSDTKGDSSSAAAANSSSLAPIPESSATPFISSQQQSRSNDTDSVSSITRDVAGYSLSAGPQTAAQSTPPSQAWVTTKNPSTTKEDFDPSKCIPQIFRNGF
jgi:hypothetical protein